MAGKTSGPSGSKAKIVVITGVTRGLGRALAGTFAAAGHTVVGCGRSEPDVETLRQSLGLPHLFDVVDVVCDDQVKMWAESFLARVGPPDLLVNNAALINRNATLWEVPADEFNRVVDVNLKGMANVVRHVLPAMISRGSGVVVNLSSGWGRSVAPEVAPYCATKWGVEGLTRALAQELPHGMAAVPLNPGIVDTDMLRNCFGGNSSNYLGPEEWAQTAAPFLLGLSAKDNGRPLTVPGQ
jgi:NAD(P)-dependent dehydrogenase (short-subunit alcohol dehydrogenase family)